MNRAGALAAFARRGPTDAEIHDPALGELLRRTDAPAGVEEQLPPQPDLWAITPELGRFLARLIVARGPTSVLEFGAGSSSVVAAHALSLIGGGRLTSLEARPEWCAERWARVAEHGTVDAQLVASSLRLRIDRCGARYEYAEAARALPGRGPFDFVLVDGPPWFFGRDGAIHSAIDLLVPGAVIVLDDAARSGERRTVSRWLRTFPGLHLAVYDAAFGRGVAVLTFDGNVASVLRPGIVLETLAETVMLARRRRQASRT